MTGPGCHGLSVSVTLITVQVASAYARDLSGYVARRATLARARRARTRAGHQLSGARPWPLSPFAVPATRCYGRRPAVYVPIDSSIHKLIEDMWETMYDAPGVGLAAPQIGISLKVVVIDTTRMSQNSPWSIRKS